LIERLNAPGLSDPPGYSHAVVACGGRLVTTAGAVSPGQELEEIAT
jgi:hypothetical protein